MKLTIPRNLFKTGHIGGDWEITYGGEFRRVRLHADLDRKHVTKPRYARDQSGTSLGSGSDYVHVHAAETIQILVVI